MNDIQITAFLQSHWEWGSMVFGAILLVGVIRDWNWLCNPVGSPTPWMCRGTRRVLFFAIGLLLIVVSIWDLLL